MAKLCKLCDQRVAQTRHHLYPRQISSRYSHLRGDREVAKTVGLCKGCHHAIHKRFTNRQLFDYYNSILRLRSHPAISRRVQLMKNYPKGYAKSGFNIPQRVNSQDIKIPDAA